MSEWNITLGQIVEAAKELLGSEGDPGQRVRVAVSVECDRRGVQRGRGVLRVDLVE